MCRIQILFCLAEHRLLFNSTKSRIVGHFFAFHFSASFFLQVLELVDHHHPNVTFPKCDLMVWFVPVSLVLEGTTLHPTSFANHLQDTATEVQSYLMFLASRKMNQRDLSPAPVQGTYQVVCWWWGRPTALQVSLWFGMKHQFSPVPTRRVGG